jgi:hypothetical protein
VCRRRTRTTAALMVAGSWLRQTPATAPLSSWCAGRRCVISDLAPPWPRSLAAGSCADAHRDAQYTVARVHSGLCTLLPPVYTQASQAAKAGSDDDQSCALESGVENLDGTWVSLAGDMCMRMSRKGGPSGWSGGGGRGGGGGV